METDPTNIDKQILWRSYDQDSGHDTRSYTCTFCKRGFSNAQALGGHMNIHRRDRAKLKQLSTNEDQLLSTDTRESDDHNTNSFNYSSHAEACEQQSCKPKRRPSIFSRDGHGCFGGKKGTQQLRQLSLFEETPSGSDYPRISNFGSDQGENRMQLGYGSSRTELDLELRLGP